MNMVIPNEGKQRFLDYALCDNATPTEDFVVELYTNDVAPGNGSTLPDFTPATFSGYAPVTLTRADFGVPVVAANVAVATSVVTPTYTCTGGAPETCYGWTMAGADSGILYAAQRFDVARVMSDGATESLDPFAIRLKTFA